MIVREFDYKQYIITIEGSLSERDVKEHLRKAKRRIDKANKRGERVRGANPAPEVVYANDMYFHEYDE